MLPNIDELCKGTLGLDNKPMNSKRITTVLEENKRLRTINRFSRNGWTQRREGIGRWVSRIPIDICLNPYSPYYSWFDPQMDDHEQKKSLLDFHRKTDYKFLVVEKI